MIQTASRLGLAEGPLVDIAMEEPVETPLDGHVGRPDVMDRQGSISAAKGPGQLAKEVFKPRNCLMDLFG